MDDSLLNLHKSDQKEIQINREDMRKRSATVYKQGNYLQRMYDDDNPILDDTTSAYMNRLHLIRNLLNDSEPDSVTLERVKETIDKLTDKEYPPSKYISGLMEVADALDAFLDTHQGTYFMPYKVKRKTVVKGLKKTVQEMLQLQRKKMESELYQNADQNADQMENQGEIPKKSQDIDKARLELAKSGVKELAKCMRQWRKRMGEYLINTPEEVIRAKLALFEPYMGDFQYYCDHTEVKDRAKEYQKLIEDYNSLKLRADLINWDKSKEGRAESYKNKSMDKAKEVATDLDSNLVEKKSLDKKYDENLRPDQVAGIQSIDRWMIRNFSNGGVGGLIGIKKLENAQESFVQKILSLSKRERLYLYYMVETKARKTATQEDMVKSQNYAPDLSEFKNQMLATKFKITKRLTGGYVYWHKLTEAMQRLNGQGILLEAYLMGKAALSEEELSESAIIRAVKEEQKKLLNSRQKENNINQEKQEEEIKNKNQEKELEKKQEKKQENATEPEKLNLLVNERTEGLKYYYRSLQLLANAIKNKSDKRIIDIAKEHSDRAYEKLMLSDEEVKKLVNSKEYVGQGYSRSEEVFSYGIEASGYISKGASKAPKILDKTAGLFWDVKSWNWLSVQRDLVITAGFFGSLTTAMGLIGGVLGFLGSKSYTANIDVAEQATGLTLGTLGLGVGIWGSIELASMSEKIATAFMQGIKVNSAAFAGSVVEKVGFGLAVVGFGLAAFQGAVAYNHHSNLKSAKTYFEERDKAALKEAKEKGDVEKERKAQKEARFNQNIAKISQAAIEQKRDSAIFATVLGSMGAVTAAMPLLAPLTTGVSIATLVMGLIQTGVKKVKDRKNDTQAFDDYFNVEKIYEDVIKNDKRFVKIKAGEKSKIAEKKKEAIKMNIRTQLAAAYGFSNVWDARIYIANQYAEYIRGKLYPPGMGERDLSDDEKSDMTTMETFIKSLGLKVNRNEETPTINQIRCKLSGGK